ncbi:MAG: carbamoyltransferase HypF [Enterobacterales bacterium]|nr:carbamoyltransferase HypF [Enterobacterales bacterium]
MKVALVENSENKPIAEFESIRVTGIVQGVGFRPNVWRIAKQENLTGQVLNDGQGVLIQIWGPEFSRNKFVYKLENESPPLARIEKIVRSSMKDSNQRDQPKPTEFVISSSQENEVQTHISPDAATCSKCMEDVKDPFGRRFRYPLTNCTHCGPRFTIIEKLPYDRPYTSMKDFEQCEDCLKEYKNPIDRRFHAQPNACYVCGPKVTLSRIDRSPVCIESLSQLDDVDAACTLLQNGEIIVIKGIGGFHFACDATNDKAVTNLRNAKQRYGKPFALMARDVKVIARYAKLDRQEEKLLNSAEAPIVLLAKTSAAPAGTERSFGVAKGERIKDLIPLSSLVAPGQNSVGFMLPYTPMHQIMLKRMNRPIVLTSANISDEPQVISNQQVIQKLGGIAKYVLWHDRDIVNRVDDSVVRFVLGKARILRRSRGYAPAPLPLPKGLDNIVPILSMGSELKNTFCIVKSGSAILSQHMGDLENAESYQNYKKNLNLYLNIYNLKPKVIAVDAHPEYLSSKLGRQWSLDKKIPLLEIQHHHAHVAACLAENQYPLNSPPVLGVALDGLGFGDDGTIWGGEFLHADYVNCKRLGCFKPVAMIGGTQAIREPWRNTFAHIVSEMGWPVFQSNFRELALYQFLKTKPLDTLSTMLDKKINTPLASSCGRLFDAVAAAMGICRDGVQYEGQAAIELETSVDQETLLNEDDLLAYPFSIPYLSATSLPYIEPLAMWQALLGDLILDTPVAVMSARFHKGLAKIIVAMVIKLCTEQEQRIINTIALTGGVFQNKILLEQVVSRLEKEKFKVLTHQQVPANDGGIALGQAVIAAATSQRRD